TEVGGDEIRRPALVLLAFDVGLVKVHVAEAGRRRELPRVRDGGSIAVQANDPAGDPRQRKREPAPAATKVERASVGQSLLGQQREEPGTDPKDGLGERHSSAPSSALKYLASGWWKTRAETEASGSIMNPSVRLRPIRSGRSRSNSTR